jgi:hypothetical protein
MDEAGDEGVAMLMGIKLASGVDIFRGAQRLGQGSVEALDHAIGLRSERFGQTMFDLEHLAGLVKGVATGRSAFGLVLDIDGEAVGELRAVIGEDHADGCGEDPGEALEEGPGGCGVAAAMDLEVDKACGPIDGPVGVGAFATQSGQMFHIEMDEAAGFGGETAGCCGFGCGSAGQAEPLQAAEDCRARQVRVQASAHHLDDVVERQAERGSQFADQRLAGGVGRLAAVMACVTSIQDLAGTVSPAPNGRLVDAKAPGQLGRWRRTALDQATHRRRGRGVPVQLNLQNRASA